MSDETPKDLPRPIPAEFKSAKTRVDGSVDVTFGTAELPPETMAELFSMRQKAGWLFFHPKPFQEIDTGNLPDVEAGGKTPSQRLRAVLFILFQQSGEAGDFNAYYARQMERFIEAVKEKLDD